MSENGLNISRRGFVAGAGAAALGAGLAGCSSGTAEKEGTDLASTSPEKTAYDPEAGEWIPTTCNMCFNNCSIKAHVVDGVVVELTGNPRKLHWQRAYLRQGRRGHYDARTIPTVSPSP